jgi:hypothetical protein
MFATFMLVSCLAYTSTLKMEAIDSSEASADFQHNITYMLHPRRQNSLYISLLVI